MPEEGEGQIIMQVRTRDGGKTKEAGGRGATAMAADFTQLVAGTTHTGLVLSSRFHKFLVLIRYMIIKINLLNFDIGIEIGIIYTSTDALVKTID